MRTVNWGTDHGLLFRINGCHCTGEMEGDVDGKKVRDLMKPLELFPWVELDDKLSKAAEMIGEFSTEGDGCRVVIVRNETGPAGLITERNIFESMEPEAFHVSQWSVPVFWPGLWAEQIDHLKNKKVSDCFVPVKMICVQAEQGLMRAVYSFNRTKMPALGVLEGQNMVGVIEKQQVFNEIIKAMIDDGKNT